MNDGPQAKAKEPEFVSGRKFIIGLVMVVLTCWGGLWLAFQSWRANYEEKAQIGREVARKIRPLVDFRPESISPSQWEDTVDHAEAMLIAVTGSNLLNGEQLVELGQQVQELVDQAHDQPERSVSLLKSLWDDLSRRAGPVANIYGRPECLSSASS